jgi:hypothetical protein
MTEIPASTKEDVKEFLRIDDGLKEARTQTKTARKELAERREKIIAFMRTSGIGKLGVKKGSQFLEAKERVIKVKPTSQAIKEKLKELVASGVSDSEQIYKAINECGGTKKVWRLSRRSKRAAAKKKKKDPSLQVN